MDRDKPEGWVKWNTRVIRKDRKTYIASMYFKEREPPNQWCVTKSSTDDKNKLISLLAKMFAKGDGAYYPSSLRAGTIVSLTSGYRIDSQTDINPNDPRINLQYQINSKTHGQVTVNMRPLIFPKGLEAEMMNNQESGGMGFTNKQVQGLIHEALKYSANKACYTDMHWVIVESRDRSRSGSRERHRSAERQDTDEKLFCVLKVLKHKLGEVAIIEKAATKSVGKNVATKALKAVPLVGLATGFYFAFARLLERDYVGAAGEVTSGVASCFPGPGTMASGAIDVALLARDVRNALS